MKSLSKLIKWIPLFSLLILASGSAFAYYPYYHHGYYGGHGYYPYHRYYVGYYPNSCRVWIRGHRDRFGYWMPAHWRFVRC